ncbi:sensor histidine kinase [Streptomyces clavuligerus]|uniref:sensor histidine kinase n=6 Tax=Streptomyces clavuligerus TaxID=1901 RepID=UPI00017FFA3B|nr:histidine kinase [Streptomyces clavuligerus]ANW20547.1 two-component sensor histidine kinase [Streptomyces clavuligerus]AXU15175.1 two-component sensor histidine kinase [Streptomyces clavuligerus]EDY50137.1 two component sensor kinase [Streptomyces clavuligerus]MBY6305243.1 two-component sensor histidine kinase [Streptomyces clavuligerus]QCS07950.1 two-component sensor histidine kinase [Streptomyces clavuligerus]
MNRFARGFARTRCWFGARPLAFDGVLAVLSLAAMVVGSFAVNGVHGPEFGTRTPAARSVVLMVLVAAALLYRRSHPRGVLVFTSLLSVIELGFGDPSAPVAMSAVIALYTVASRTDRPTTWRVGLITMAGLTGTAMFFGSTPWYTQENIAIFAWTGMASAAGDAVRSRRDFVDAIRERAERAERTREEEARRRVAEERLRIARDLHDVVAHHIALVNVQAGVAAHVMDRRPDQAKEALAHVREASRSALNELRATVGLLRQSGDPEAPTEPAPGLAVLDDLVTTFRQAGLPVEVARADEGAAPPSAVDLAAYRIIQEALTNVRKHAGDQARAEVSVVRVGLTLEVTVLDDGPSGRVPAPAGPRDPDAPEGGHGLIGMRERVAALGGRLSAGPRYGGGFRVQAILPLTARTGEDI